MNNTTEKEQKETASEKNLPYSGYHYKYPEPKPFKEESDIGRFLFGFVLIVFGLLFLAKNFNWISFRIEIDFRQLWPLLLIFIGLSMYSGRRWFSIVFLILLTFVALGIAIFLIFGR